jgi:hypothetical protein
MTHPGRLATQTPFYLAGDTRNKFYIGFSAPKSDPNYGHASDSKQNVLGPYETKAEAVTIKAVMNQVCAPFPQCIRSLSPDVYRYRRFTKVRSIYNLQFGRESSKHGDSTV